MTISNTAVTTRYNLGPVQPYVERAAYIIGPQFGVKTVYGWRKSDPFPDHPSGHALDFMTPSKAAGDALAAYVIANAQALGVKYIIWYRRYWSPSTGWEAYTETSNPHTDHVHVTFNDTPGIATSGATPRGLTNAATLASIPSSDNTGDTCGWKIGTSAITPDYCVLSKVQIRHLVGGSLVVAGGGIVIIGVVLLLVYGLQKTGAASAIPGVGRVISRL